MSRSISYEDRIGVFYLLFPNVCLHARVDSPGDSGGPIILPGDTPEEDVQVGVISWYVPCQNKSNEGSLYNLFTNRSSHLFLWRVDPFSFTPRGEECASAVFPGVAARVSFGYDWIQQWVCVLDGLDAPEYFDCMDNVTYSPAPSQMPNPPTFSPAPSLEVVDVVVHIQL